MTETPADHCVVVAKPHPFASDAVCASIRASTIAQMLGEHASRAVEVRVGGKIVPPELWAHVRPKPGQILHATVVPQGGNAGKWLKLIAIIVISYFTFGAGSAAAAAWLGVGTTTLQIIGMVAILAINALIPPPSLKGGIGGSSDPFNQLASITGTSNQASPYGVIPCVVGKMRFFPPHAALPYTETLGDDQYLRMLLDLGYGDLDISDIQIGETAITSYTGVETEISTSPTLFSQDVYELSIGVELDDAGNNAIRTTQSATTEISLDLIGPQGIFGVDSKGNTVTGSIQFNIVYRATGSSTWLPVGGASGLALAGGISNDGSSTITITSGARKTYRGGVRWKVPSGQYDVSVTRVTAKGIGFPGAVDTNSVISGIQWTVMRSFSPQLPSTTGTLKLAVRIKATDQLQGIVQNLSVLAAQKVPMWDKQNQVWLASAETENPAWIYAWLLTRCQAVQRRLPDSRLDLDGIADWADECAAKALVCSFVMDSARAFSDVLRDVLASGRASFGMVNGKYGAVRDKAQTVPVQMFTPSNSWGFSYQRAFGELPHALRVNFTNPEANYQQDVCIVYADGYNADGSGGLTAATKFEQLDLRMVTDPDAAWRLGRYHLAVGYNRPTMYSLNTDIEGMVCERGDLVRVAHDITEWGSAWGRFVSVSSDGLTVTLQGTVDLVSGTNYQLQARKSDGTQATVNVTSAAGTGLSIITLSASTGAAAGDLWVLGEVNHGTADLIVKSVKPSDNLTANIIFVDAAPAVLTADSGTPPMFVSAITGKAWCDAPDPPQLQLIVTGTPDDAGTHRPVVGVSLPPQSGIWRAGLRGPESYVANRRFLM